MQSTRERKGRRSFFETFHSRKAKYDYVQVSITIKFDEESYFNECPCDSSEEDNSSGCQWEYLKFQRVVVCTDGGVPQCRRYAHYMCNLCCAIQFGWSGQGATMYKPLTRLLLPGKIASSQLFMSHASFTNRKFNYSMVVGEIRIIYICLDDKTAEEAGGNECTQHYWSNGDGCVECCDLRRQGGAGIGGIHGTRSCPVHFPDPY